MKVYALVALLLVGVYCEESVNHGAPSHRRDAGHYKAGEHDDDFDHEAILGDEMDAFSKLSPEEGQERLGALIDRMDSNSDGNIDKDELKAWIKHSFENINMEETRGKMESDDANEDGQLSWSEYLEAIYGMSESDLETYKTNDLDDPESMKVMTQSLDYDKKKFTAADQSGDGSLSLEEYASFLHPYDYDHMSSIEAERVMQQYDVNSDGKVTMEEYLGDAQFKDRSREDMIAEEENFKYNDENKDGELDLKEVTKWVSPNILVIADEEADHLMAETDENQDGKLSKKEILEQSELWVGSEVTDYGNMLLDKDEL